MVIKLILNVFNLEFFLNSRNDLTNMKKNTTKINRNMEESLTVDFNFEGFDGLKLIEHVALENDDMKAVNTEESPDTVKPINKTLGDKIVLAPHSWNMLRFGK